MKATDLVTLKEAAELLRRSPSQLQWMRHRKEGPPSALLAGRVFYRKQDIEAWVDAEFAKEAS